MIYTIEQLEKRLQTSTKRAEDFLTNHSFSKIPNSTTTQLIFSGRTFGELNMTDDHQTKSVKITDESLLDQAFQEWRKHNPL